MSMTSQFQLSNGRNKEWSTFRTRDKTDGSIKMTSIKFYLSTFQMQCHQLEQRKLSFTNILGGIITSSHFAPPFTSYVACWGCCCCCCCISPVLRRELPVLPAVKMSISTSQTRFKRELMQRHEWYVRVVSRQAVQLKANQYFLRYHQERLVLI